MHGHTFVSKRLGELTIAGFKFEYVSLIQIKMTLQEFN